MSPDGASRPGGTGKARSGIYVAEFFNPYVFGYPLDNSKNGPPTCRVYNPYASVNDIAVDGDSNLIIPLEIPNEVLVYNGTRMCGRWAATIADPYGQPTGAAANDAIHGTIAVANILDLSGSGSISLCTVSGGCTQNLTNPSLYEVGGVAMDRQGNCWASGFNPSYSSVLIYFAGCSGSGVAATGIANTQGYGSIDIDKNGNLVVVSIPTDLYVYRGCKPKCKKSAVRSRSRAARSLGISIRIRPRSPRGTTNTVRLTFTVTHPKN